MILLILFTIYPIISLELGLFGRKTKHTTAISSLAVDEKQIISITSTRRKIKQVYRIFFCDFYWKYFFPNVM